MPGGHLHAANDNRPRGEFPTAGNLPNRFADEANAPITGIVISQKKWFDIMGIRDNQGRYLGEGPFGITAPRIWGLPTVPSNSMAENDFLVGSFGSGIGAQIYDRMGVEVLISTEHGTNFSDNEITVRIENP
jgi:HK97 family phage major capsid protein